MRLLVADDDRVLSRLLCARLKADGWETTAAFDAMQALMFAMRNPPPDAIVLDIGMPGGTGLDALRKLRASTRTAQIPVVVITATADEGVARTAKELGAEGFLAKPVDPQALSSLLSEIVKPS